MMNKLIIGLTSFFLMFATANAADINGDWNLMLTAAEGSTSVGMKITVDGEKATGKSGDSTMEGTYIDGELTLSGDLYLTEAGFSSSAKLVATMQGDELVGNMDWDAYSMNIIGSR